MIKRGKLLILFAIIISSLTLLSCGKNGVEDNESKWKRITLDEGSIVENDNGDYENYLYKDNEYVEINDSDNGTVALYDYDSKNYIMMKDNEYIACIGDKKTKLTNIGILDNSFNMSPGGKYLLFFRNEEYCKLQVLSLESGKLLDLNIDVSISGKYVDWLDDHTLVYYGVRDKDKTNAIFTYDLNSKKEDIYLKLEEGYIEYIKSLDDGVVYSVGNFNGEKKLIKISVEGKNSEVLSTDIKKVYDLIELDGVYYILGSFKNSDYALYSLSNGVQKRITYSFPSNIDLNKGLSKTKDGSILFIGSNNIDFKQEIYKSTKDGAVSLIKSGNNEINFIKRSN